MPFAALSWAVKYAPSGLRRRRLDDDSVFFTVNIDVDAGVRGTYDQAHLLYCSTSLRFVGSTWGT